MPSSKAGPFVADLTPAAQALADAVHDLRCRPLFTPDPGHPPGSTEPDLDRAWSRFLLAQLASAGWALAPTSGDEVVELRGAVAEVRSLHMQYRNAMVDAWDTCAHCSGIAGYPIQYPCATVQAVDKHADRGRTT